MHTKLLEIEKALSDDPNRRVLLFIDEINRCEHAVQQELMNIILNREINGYKLSDKVDVIAAMNPSSKYNDFEYSNYQVVDMDPAQEDRFVWIDLDCDVNSWIEWGTSKKGNINEDILAFIATFPEYLHTPYSEEAIKATPRSWERVSKSYNVYLQNKSKYALKIFYNVVKGNVGGSIAQDFMNFLEESKNPLLKPEEIFEKDTLDENIIEKIKKESHSRLYLQAKNAILYLQNLKERKREVDIFSKFIQLYPDDLKMGLMKEIKLNCDENLYKEFLKNEIFIEGFFEMYQ